MSCTRSVRETSCFPKFDAVPATTGTTYDLEGNQYREQRACTLDCSTLGPTDSPSY